MATLRKRGSTYFVDYHFRGRRVRRSAGTSRRVALDILRDIQGRLVRDDAGLSVLDKAGDQALAEFLDECRARNSPRWVRYQEAVLTDFLTESGVRRLRHITPPAVEKWQRRRRSETSPSTARTNYVILRSWLRWAKRSGYLQDDPTDHVKRLPKPPKAEIKFLSEDAAKKLLKACQAPVPFHGRGRKGKGTSRPRKTPLHEMAAVALYAGLRLGEILHLYWEDVAFKTNGGVVHIRVRESFVPKDKEGRRIPLHSRLKKILRDYQKKTGRKERLIFQTSNGTIFEGRNVVRQLQGAAERAGIKDGCNFYLLRHTFASWLTMRGVSLHKIAKFLGHSSVTTTERHYAALVPETLHEDIEKLQS